MKGIIASILQVGAMLGAKTQTRQYPEVKPDLPPRTRARIILTRDPDGAERCVACNLCAAVCPSDCIEVTKAADAWQAEGFRINLARCIFCGFCEEACPTAAIQLTPDFELADYTRESLIYDKPDLLIAGTGKDATTRYRAVAGKGKAATVDVKDLTP